MTETLRVVHLMDHVISAYGGTEQHMIWLQNHLPRDQFELHFLVFSQFDASPEAFPISPYNLGQVFGNNKWSYLKRFNALVRYLCEHNIDLLHAFSPVDELFACYAARSAQKKLRKKIAIVGHRRNIGFALNRKLLLMGRLTRKFPIAYLANSRAAIEAAFEKEGIAKERFTVIYNPVSKSRFEAGLASPMTRAELGVDENAFLIGSIATIRRIKGFETLVRAAKSVVERHPTAHFLCIGKQGDAEYLAELRTLAAELGLTNHITWFGDVDNPYRVLPNFDLAVLASHSESFSNSVLEYAASGRPIVASNVGGMPEIITDGTNGFLVPAKEPERLAEKIVTLIENPVLRRSFAEQAAETARKHFDETDILRQYCDFYRAAAR